MEPRREEPSRKEPKAPKPATEERKKRFRIVKLEERIAPRHSHQGGGHGETGGTCTTLSIE